MPPVGRHACSHRPLISACGNNTRRGWRGATWGVDSLGRTETSSWGLAMCLSVYFGTSFPLVLDTSVPVGGLKLERVEQGPLPLRRMSHVYRAGRAGENGVLGCSCLLHERVNWDRDPLLVQSDTLYPEQGACPFKVLQRYCEDVLAKGGWARLVCDDGDSPDTAAEESDYDEMIILTDHIVRGRLIFASTHGGFPWRVLTVLPSTIQVARSDSEAS